jgi:hypothetical protein
MLKGNPQVFHYTTFATADKLFSSHPIWQQARIEAERRHIFEDYVNELKQREIVSLFLTTTSILLIMMNDRLLLVMLEPVASASSWGCSKH